jgi:hypothetical protein
VKALEDNFDGSVGRIALMNKLAARTDLLNQQEKEPVPKPKLRLESEIDDLKVQVLKFESDQNQETDRRKIAKNKAKAAEMMAENLLKESQMIITRGIRLF